MSQTSEGGRRYPARPIIGVGGLVYQDGAVLLIKRAKEPGKGLWSIPGGAVKVGETLEEGVTREMAEETGLNVRVGPLVGVVERIFHDPDAKIVFHYVVMDFICEPIDSQIPRPGSDAADICFAPPEKWLDYGMPEDSVNLLRRGLKMQIAGNSSALESSFYIASGPQPLPQSKPGRRP